MYILTDSESDEEKERSLLGNGRKVGVESSVDKNCTGLCERERDMIPQVRDTDSSVKMTRFSSEKRLIFQKPKNICKPAVITVETKRTPRNIEVLNLTHTRKVGKASVTSITQKPKSETQLQDEEDLSESSKELSDDSLSDDSLSDDSLSDGGDEISAWEAQCMEAGLGKRGSYRIIRDTSADVKLFISFTKFVPAFLREFEIILDVDSILSEVDENRVLTQLEQNAASKLPSLLNKTERDENLYNDAKLIRYNGEFLTYSDIDRILLNEISVDGHDPLSKKHNPSELPVMRFQDEICSSVMNNNVTLIISETGSGKTTMIPQLLLKAGFGGHEHGHLRGKYKYSLIGCTQPRRVAAMSIAQYVASMMSTKCGSKVGYSIRFEDKTSEGTVLRYMTDNYLLRELLSDRMLYKYDALIIDEAHERSLATDLLLFVLCDVIAKRPEFRLIITSATMDPLKFMKYFETANVISVPGRHHSVDIRYLPSTPSDYIKAAATEVLKLHLMKGVGYPCDILVFLTGQAEIRAFCHTLSHEMQAYFDSVRKKVSIKPFALLPIYSAMPTDRQQLVFKKMNVRKIIVATNIAESSLTLDGVKYVIDCGFAKVNNYSPRLRMEALVVQPISRNNAQQRAGRAGRTAPGICYRLYTENDYLSLNESPTPEILRANVSSVLLTVLSVNPSLNIFKLSLLDRPSDASVANAMYCLYMIGAVDDGGKITQIGSLLSNLPLDPYLGRCLISAAELGVAGDMIRIVGMISVPRLWYHENNPESMSRIASSRLRFAVSESDHLSLLNVYSQWERTGFSSGWARQNCLQEKSLMKINSIVKQLFGLVSKMGLPVENNITMLCDRHTRLRKALSQGYIHQIARQNGIGKYDNILTGVSAELHPSSSLRLCGRISPFIIYSEIVSTSREYIINATEVNPLWIREFSPTFFTVYDLTENLTA